ncbi:MAG: hypothetical protein JNL88_01925 [Bacteroidia bacterium]|nr:hypothetical protein [Bacteroidia bacterium]
MKKIRQLPLLLLAGLSMSIFSCTFIAKEMMGVRSIKTLDDKKHRRFLRKLGAPPGNAYSIDTTYLEFIGMRDTQRTDEKKNHYQPIQALYFGQQEFPGAWFINCYAGGFPNLQWNRGRFFDTFPPTSAAPVDSLVSFTRLFGHAKPLLKGPLPSVGAGQPYTVVLYWNRFMFRQSRRLHDLVRENLEKSAAPYRILYINNDHLFTGLERE